MTLYAKIMGKAAATCKRAGELIARHNARRNIREIQDRARRMDTIEFDHRNFKISQKQK